MVGWLGTLARAVGDIRRGSWEVVSSKKGELDRVTYASVRVNPNELFTAGNGDGDDVCHGSDQYPGLEHCDSR